ncbi:cora-domain-containing protein [Coccomyxa subellipsoidea C-169]|uniref:Magnesium transporter n=1 Tax=Coccomyxa subellipsoidea (strain C-169) TaxID=574566 RepID=I0YUS1_COCSC|nr:cora-domain-containing protein [Coccomyxa subellipsoidea C-169]EIE22140.1 cora-domain-containing protein [Coccomyxa subellipsoidea C-169]|eukprot:XP_005646684.1 cora-domain-containing protein [Coccomyxa subellipsoidea C-169]
MLVSAVTGKGANGKKKKPPLGLDTHMLNNRTAAAAGATTSATTRAGLHGSFTSARTGSTSKLQGLSRSASGPLLPDRSANSEASGSDAGSGLRRQKYGGECGGDPGSLLDLPNRTPLPGGASAAVRGALGGKGNAVDALALKGIFDRRQLTVAGARKWMLVDDRGDAWIIEADRSLLTAQLNLHSRDLRLLDPMLTQIHPSAILCRERVLLVNLEGIKCMVTTDYVLVLNVDRPMALDFLDELQRRLRQQADALMEDADIGAESGDRDHARMPFELRALEVALDVTCQHFERLTKNLETVAVPLLQTATASKVTTDFLDRLRQMKARMNGLKTKVETMKEVLEKYLEDEDDMLDMNLTARGQGTRHASFQLQRESMQRHKGPSRHSLSLVRHTSGHWPQLSVRTSMHSAGANFSEDGGEGGSPDDLAEQMEAAAEQLAAAKRAAEARRREEAITEVEMVLQTYFHNLDNSYNKLQTINEYMDDVEEFIDLEMDAYRNNVIRMRVMLNASALSGVIIFTISNIFGMNLGVAPDRLQGNAGFSGSTFLGYPLFLTVTIVTCGASVLVYMAFLLYLHLVKLGPSNISG